MSETKWTPGPWRVGIDRRAIWDDEDRCIAVAKSETHQLEANARLIAAAPDLYEALASMHAQHRCGCGHPACNRCADDRECAAALAKARGES